MHEVSPTHLRDYVKALGWTFVEEATGDGLFLFNHPSEEFVQLKFPTAADAPDYRESLDIVFNKLAEFSARPISAISEAIEQINSDKIRFRLFKPSGILETVSISDSSQMLDGIRRMLLSSACSLKNKRSHHPRLRGTLAQDFLNACQLGHTEKGSFIWKVSCPLDAVTDDGDTSQNTLFSLRPNPYTRKVTSLLHSGLSGLQRALLNDSLETFVENAPQQGVTSNLCEGLLSLLDEKTKNSLEIISDWSPRVKYEGSLQKLRFEYDYASRIEDIQKALTPNATEETNDFVGTVEKLEGETNDEGNREGFVVLNLLIQESGETVKARGYLDAKSHAIAIRAYEKEGSYISVKGRLKPGRQPRQLVSPSGFCIVDRARTEK
ncbi:MAG: hypothetical protein COA70_03745 [Planctomycetota bacterium]|nr:MAG: hypothetical protein COA70_03745 [Planctomycetota bacterium]